MKMFFSQLLAESDGSGKLIFWIVVGVGYLLKLLWEHITKAKEGETSVPMEPWGKMDGGATPPAPAPMPRPIAVRRRPVPVVPQTSPSPYALGGENTEVRARHALDGAYQATTDAAASMAALSDAEQAALDRIRRPKPQNGAGGAQASTMGNVVEMKQSLRGGATLRTAILYGEILGKPKALSER